MFTVAELAAVPSLADLGSGFSVGADDAARAPFVLVDADSAAHSSPDLVAAAAAVLRDGLGVGVLVARGGVVPPVLGEAADIVLTQQPVSGADSAAVGTPDPRAEAERLAEVGRRFPVAAMSLMLALRASARASVNDALAIESATYSMLLAGSEFRRWLDARRTAHPARPAGSADRVRVTRTDDVLAVRLIRTDRRNAVDAAMRNALVAALEIARWDPSVRVEISADGPSFSAGGDLDEFGRAGDVASAHLVRLAASVGALMHELRDRLTVSVHGACIGAGIELPAFASRVVATPDATFTLPEVGMGLIPGAGGTVSIARRIGRQRTGWLALSGQPIDAARALAWGLIDAVE